MKFEVLGCAGGIGGREVLTTSFLVDDDLLLDAGTGLGRLPLERLSKIDHVFLTHSHLDHVAGLAFLLDAVLGKREQPVTVHATEKVIAGLKKHLFNWILWPDFAVIPTQDNAILQWSVLEPGASMRIKGRTISAHPVNHMVGSSAYWVRTEQSGLLFTGDMSTTPELWQAFRNEPLLQKVVVDCSFVNADRVIADLSLHYCPETLLADIVDMPSAVEFMIYHLKPGHEDTVMQQLQAGNQRAFTALRNGDQIIL